MGARPRVTLATSQAFNEVLTFDLKEFGCNYVLWMIDSFTRFIQRKVMTKKKTDTIIITLTDSWCINVGFPLQGFFADNGGEFANIKLDKITSTLGLTVKFGPSYSLWFNGINERNHSSTDITIKKLMEEHRAPLTDSFVKAAAWTHNTSVKKLDIHHCNW